MKKLGFIFVMILFLMTLICSLNAHAGDIYTYKDKNGNIVITNEPIPEKYEKKAKKIDSYKRDSPEVIQRYETERNANIQRQDAETRQKQQINRAQEESRKQNNQRQAQQRKGQSEIQDSRNREADKLEAEARKNIPGSHGMTASQRNMLENAARIRTGQEPVPYTQPEPSPTPLPKGAINVQTGEYYPPAAGGIINPRTGGVMPDVGGGYIDDKTGKFIPKQ